MMRGKSTQKRGRGLLVAGAFAMTLVFIASCGSGGESGQAEGGQAENTEVRIGGPGPFGGLWPVYVAQSEGFFERAGVEVTVTYAGGGQGVQQVVGGDLEVFVTHPDQPVAAIDKGGKILGISGSINTSFSLVGRPGVANIEALRNQTVGVATLAGADSSMMLAFLANHGLKTGDYTVTQAGSGPNKLGALSTGEVSAVTLTQPQDLQYLTQTPGATKLGDSSELGELQTVAAFANSEWAAANGDGLVKFLRAQLDAREWLASPENRSKAISVFAENTKVSETIAAAVYDQYVTQGLFKTALEVDLAGADRWLTLAEDAGLGEYGPASQYFDTSYLERAKNGGN